MTHSYTFPYTLHISIDDENMNSNNNKIIHLSFCWNFILFFASNQKWKEKNIFFLQSFIISRDVLYKCQCALFFYSRYSFYSFLHCCFWLWAILSSVFFIFMQNYSVFFSSLQALVWHLNIVCVSLVERCNDDIWKSGLRSNWNMVGVIWTFII